MRLAAPGIVAVLAALTACAAGPVAIGGTQYASYYDPNLIRYATRTGEIPVVVRGAPFGDPAGIVAAMTAPAWLGSVHFVPATGAEGGYRVILQFGSAAESEP